jgi:hypothetical protein
LEEEQEEVLDLALMKASRERPAAPPNLLFRFTLDCRFVVLNFPI